MMDCGIYGFTERIGIVRSETLRRAKREETITFLQGLTKVFCRNLGRKYTVLENQEG